MTKSDSPAAAEVLPDTAVESARAKPLRDLPAVEAPLRLVPARMVNEVLYCERLMYLEWVQDEWESNAFTADGTRVHKRVDASKKKLKPPAAATKSPSEKPTAAEKDTPYQARSVTLSSERLGLTAKLDVVDVEDGRTLAVEFKRGKKPNVPEGAYLPERAQLCCHVLLLRDNGYQCDGGEIYFAGDHQRTPIVIDDALIDTTLTAIKRVRELAYKGQLPSPLVNSPKCPYCSLNAICLPDETNYLRAKHLPLFVSDTGRRHTPLEAEVAPISEAADLDESVDDDSSPEPDEQPAKGDTAAAESPLPRPLFTRRDEKLPMYVTKQGASVRLDGHQLLVYAEGEKLHEARLPGTSHVSLFGNVQISTQAIRSLLERGIGVHFFTYGGWWSGACVGADSNNVDLRIAQFRAADNAELSLRLARGWVYSKIANCRTLLRRNHRDAPPAVLNELKILGRKALHAPSVDTLLGLEGTAARTYFSEFAGMLNDAAVSHGFSWETRNRRPPKDRLNAMLSFAYSLLTKDVTAACRTAGLDPLLGFYHRPQFGRPSLALDLMEEFRPLVADSTVINVVNNNILDADDFQLNGTGVALADRARRKFIQAYEKRQAQEVLHPVFGYRVSYRRVLELQARLLTRFLLGEIEHLPPFKTR